MYQYTEFDKQFVRNKKVPFKGKLESLVVLAIYHDETEVRVYALSLENDKVPPHRFVIDRNDAAEDGVQRLGEAGSQAPAHSGLRVHSRCRTRGQNAGNACVFDD